MKGRVIPIKEVSSTDVDAMFALMDEFYDNMDRAVFESDFYAKDYCIVLRNDEGKVVGFTTQKVMSVDVDGKEIHGMFSGDTIIHKDYWGDTELFRVWAQFWFPYAENYDAETPEYERKIIDAYAFKLYPDEYNPVTGVIEYKHTKDKLKSGVADIDERRIKNKDIAFFNAANPNHADGNDLACLAKIDRTLLRRHAEDLLFR